MPVLLLSFRSAAQESAVASALLSVLLLSFRSAAQESAVPLRYSILYINSKLALALLRLQRSLFERGDIELLHRHHGLHRGWMTKQFPELRWNNLPAEAKLVLEPAAAKLRAAITKLRTSNHAESLLGLASHREGKRFAKLVRRSSVQKSDLLAIEFEFHNQ